MKAAQHSKKDTIWAQDRQATFTVTSVFIYFSLWEGEMKEKSSHVEV